MRIPGRKSSEGPQEPSILYVFKTARGKYASFGFAAFLGLGSVTILRKVPEFIWWGSDVGDGLWDLSIGVLGAWVFNLLAIALPARRDQLDIYYAVGSELRAAAHFASDLTHQFAIHRGLKCREHYTENEIRSIMDFDFSSFPSWRYEHIQETVVDLDREHRVIGALSGRLPAGLVAAYETVMSQPLVQVVRAGELEEMIQRGKTVHEDFHLELNEACALLRSELTSEGLDEVRERRIVAQAERKIRRLEQLGNRIQA